MTASAQTPTPQFVLQTRGDDPGEVKFAVSLSATGLLKVTKQRLFTTSTRTAEVRLSAADTSELTLLASQADDFTVGCSDVAHGTSARLTLSMSSVIKPVIRECENAAKWPKGPKTMRFLERLNERLPSDMRVF